nr:hypothetical protein Cry52Nrm1_p037 [Cryptomonas curvata]
MFYCHFIIFCKEIEDKIIILKYNQNNPIFQKNTKHTILKKIFQNKTTSFEFFGIFLLSSLSTGSYNLKKKSLLNALFEITYKLKLEYNLEKYYIGKFNLKNASLVVKKIESSLKQIFYESKTIKNDLSNYFIVCDKSFNKKEHNNQFIQENIDNIKYVFRLSKSKLSTSLLDEFSVINVRLGKENSFFQKYQNFVLLQKKKIFFDSISLELINLYIFYTRNLKKTTKIKYLVKLAFSIYLGKSLKCFTFFLGFIFSHNFSLSSEIVFNCKNCSFNPSKFIVDRYFQVIREKYKLYSSKVFNFFLILINKFFFYELKKNFLYYKKTKYTMNKTKFEQPSIIFQKKFIERIGEKLWNLKMRFSEFQFDVYLKKYKKHNSKKEGQCFMSKWISCIISIYYYCSSNFFNKNQVNFKIPIYTYILFNYILILKLNSLLKGWSNFEIDSVIFFSSYLKSNKCIINFLYKNFYKLLLKKKFRYTYTINF